MDITFDIFNSCFTHHSDVSGIFCPNYVHTEREARYSDDSGTVIPQLREEHAKCRRSSADRREWIDRNAGKDYGVRYFGEDDDNYDDNLKSYKVQYCTCPDTFSMTIGKFSYKSALNVFNVGDILIYKNTQRCAIAPMIYRRLLEKIPTMREYMQVLPVTREPSHFQGIAFLDKLKNEIANRLYEISDEMFEKSDQVKQLTKRICEIVKDVKLDSRLILAYSSGKIGDLAMKIAAEDLESPTDEQRERLADLYELITLSKLYDMLADVDAASVLRFSAKPSTSSMNKSQCMTANLTRMYID